MEYPIHNYGTGGMRAGVQSWVQGKAQKQAAMLKAIMETAPYMKDFTAGSPAYEKVKEAFGPQVTQAVANQASAIKEQREVKARVDAFDMGNKYLSGLESIDKMIGKKAYSTPLFQNMANAASESFKRAGINFNYNNLLSYKENIDKLNEASINSINRVISGIKPGDATTSQLKSLEIALQKYKQVPGSNKDFLEGASALYEREAKIVAEKEKEKRTALEWDRQQKIKQGQEAAKNASPLKKEYNDFLSTVPNGSEYKDENGKPTINLLDYVGAKKQAEKDPIVAATSLAEKNMMVQLGKKDLGEAVQEILNVWQKLGYIGNQKIQTKSDYESPESVAEAFKSGTITKEQALKILREKFNFE